MVKFTDLVSVVALTAATVLPSVSYAQQTAQGAWGTQCIAKTRNSAPQCSMQHTVTVQETGQVLFNLTLRAALASDKAPYLDVVAPLGFFLPAGLDLSIDGKALINLPVQRCDAKGCYAGSVLNEEQLEMLQDNDIMNISFSPQREQVAEVAVPLTGFGSAYDGIKH